MHPENSDELVEVAVEYKHHTSKAVRFDHGDGEVWVPKSLINLDDSDYPINGSEPDWAAVNVIAVPEWYAYREGLI